VAQNGIDLVAASELFEVHPFIAVLVELLRNTVEELPPRMSDIVGRCRKVVTY
jgi:hypothetical protein